MKRANPDIVAISAHPFTTCGVLKEMERQGVKPKLLIGLTVVVEHRDAARLRQAGGRDHHPDQLRAGHAGGHQGGRERRQVRRQRRPAQRGGLRDHVHPQGRDRAAEDHGQARHGRGRPRQDARRARGPEGDDGPARQGRATPTAKRSSRSSTSTPRTAAGRSCTSRRPDRHRSAVATRVDLSPPVARAEVPSRNRRGRRTWIYLDFIDSRAVGRRRRAVRRDLCAAGHRLHADLRRDAQDQSLVSRPPRSAPPMPAC